MAIIITNRRLCRGDFFERINFVAQRRPRAVILREKDLSEDEYTRLAAEVKKITDRYNTELIINSFINAAKKTGIKKIHLPIDVFEEKRAELNDFELIGASVHSVQEAKRAEKAGADYVMAGHIFETDCKKGLKPRGLDFLREICRAVNIPVYAIGGINNENQGLAMECGATDVCVMSGAMTGEYRL